MATDQTQSPIKRGMERVKKPRQQRNRGVSDHIPMTLADVSAANHAERFNRFLTLFAGHDEHKRTVCHHIAWKAATTEMLDEIHTMLRHLTGAG